MAYSKANAVTVNSVSLPYLYVSLYGKINSLKLYYTCLTQTITGIDSGAYY